MSLWARYETSDGRIGFGQLQQDHIVEYEGDLFREPHATGSTILRSSVRLLAPCEPGKIIALWNNFHALGAKLGKPVPQHPLYFFKASSSVVGTGAAIRRPRNYAGKIIFEGELGIVIGRPCQNVSAAAARDHILGYTCVNDVTAFDQIAENPDFAQWTRSKSYDTFGCLGPVIATHFDLATAHVIVKLDGVERQNYALADMIFKPEELVSRISFDQPLAPGDVIACGTSLGTGSIKDGVSVEVSIAGIGALTNALATGTQ